MIASLSRSLSVFSAKKLLSFSHNPPIKRELTDRCTETNCPDPLVSKLVASLSRPARLGKEKGVRLMILGGRLKGKNGFS